MTNWKAPVLVAFIVCMAFIAALLFFCAGMGGIWPFQTLVNLAFGWAFFLHRAVPQTTVNWGGVLTAVLCLAGLTLGLHWFLSWLHGHIQKVRADQTEVAKAWPLRRTFAIIGIVVLTFVAGISAVGVAHQTVWLANSPEPLTSIPTMNRIVSSSHLKEIGLALAIRADKEKTLPAGVVMDSEGRVLHGWQTQLLPYIEENTLHHEIRHDLPWSHPDNASCFRTGIKVYTYPGSPQYDANGYALSHYAGNIHVLGTYKRTSIKEIEQSERGTARTILAGEASGNYKPWGHPANWRDPALGINESPNGFGSPNRKGASVVFADGHVEFVPNDDPAGVLAPPSSKNKK